MTLMVYIWLLLSSRTNNITKIKFTPFTEAFPEIKNLWPIWVKKQGCKIKCLKDDDCLFPQACCHHPIIPGENFCCDGGYKIRKFEYAFATQYNKI
jgi:hypothetical protein